MTIDIRRVDAHDIRTHKDGFIELLKDVVDGGSSVNFIAPLDLGIAAAFWDKVADDAEAEARIVLAAFDEDRVVGTAQLVLAIHALAVHRAEAQKVLVHTRARRQGIASKLMHALEAEARAAGRSLIVLDTEQYSGGEALYESVGYVRVGVIPGFAFNSDGSKLINAVFFYKNLTP